MSDQNETCPICQNLPGLQPLCSRCPVPASPLPAPETGDDGDLVCVCDYPKRYHNEDGTAHHMGSEEPCYFTPAIRAPRPVSGEGEGLNFDVAVMMVYGYGPAAFHRLPEETKEGLRSVFRTAIQPLITAALKRKDAQLQQAVEALEGARKELSDIRWSDIYPTPSTDEDAFAGALKWAWKCARYATATVDAALARIKESAQ